MRVRRHNLAWIGVLTGTVGVALLGGGVTAPVGLALLGLYGGAVAASLIDLEVRPDKLIDRSRDALAARRMSPEARDAVERARRRGSMLMAGITLTDLGLITMQRTDAGMDIRRTWSVSKDADSMRPFITLNVGGAAADRAAVVRFELLDAEGREQYVNEQRVYLRDGDVNVIADHHLVLASDKLRAGEWDMRVSVDGVLIGAHMFTLSPSLRERFPHLAQQAERARRNLEDAPAPRGIDATDEPMSLEDLLRGANSQSENGSNGTRTTRPRG